jgi:hypothetical protein
MATMKGQYIPKNPQKYLGDPTKIRFLSSWERRFMEFCDMNPNVLAWGSETFRVQYYNPIKQKICTYLPDFMIKFKDRDGNVINRVIEIKPKKEAMITKKMTTYDKVCLVVNQAKWTACKAICESYGVDFKVYTEDDLFLK